MDARAAAKLEADLQALSAPCLGAYSPRTFKGYAADLRVFAAWCDAHQCRWLPALPHDIARFIAHLSPQTVSLLQQWLAAAGIGSGPVFRALHLGRPSNDALNTSSIRRLVKRALRRAGMPVSGVDGFSGHSMRVGAAQDMMVAGYGALAIIQAGGWKSADVVLRYVEEAATQDLHARRWTALAQILAKDVGSHPPVGAPDLSAPRPYLRNLRMP